MSLLKSLILGLVQGLTEFLPISSSGHLVLAEEVLKVTKQGVTFEVFLHFGTLLAVLIAFKEDIKRMLLAVIGVMGSKSLKLAYNNIYFKLFVLILWGSIPAALVGFLFKDLLESAFEEPILVSVMLLVTGMLLFLTRFVKSSSHGLGIKVSFLIGIAQAFAIIPGISRSGATISTGLFWGIPREEAARFSFLLAIPAILGATLLKTKELIASPPQLSEALQLSLGTVTAFVSGYIAIKILLDVVRRGKLHRFSYYCFALGILGLIALS